MNEPVEIGSKPETSSFKKNSNLLTQNQINFIMKNKKIKEECYFFLPPCRVTMTTKNSLKWAFLQHPSNI